MFWRLVLLTGRPAADANHHQLFGAASCSHFSLLISGAERQHHFSALTVMTSILSGSKGERLADRDIRRRALMRVRGICEKPKIKCTDCQFRIEFLPIVLGNVRRVRKQEFLEEEIYVDRFEGGHYDAGCGGKFRLFEGRFQ